MSDTDIRLDLQAIRMEGEEIKNSYRDDIANKGLAATISEFGEKYNTRTLKELSRKLTAKFGRQPQDVASCISAMEEQMEDLAVLKSAEWQADALQELQAATKMGVYIARVRALQQVL